MRQRSARFAVSNPCGAPRKRRVDPPLQVRRVTARGYNRLAVLASLFVGLHQWGQGSAGWAVALDMALSCAVLLLVQPTKALLSEVRQQHRPAERAGAMTRPQERHADRGLASGHDRGREADAGPVLGPQPCLGATRRRSPPAGCILDIDAAPCV